MRSAATLLAGAWVALAPATCAEAAGEALQLYQSRFRSGNDATEPSYYGVTAVTMWTGSMIEDLDLTGPGGVSLVVGGAPQVVNGVAPYDFVRAPTIGTNLLVLRMLGEPTVDPPLADGTYTAVSTALGFSTDFQLGGSFPEYPVVASPSAGDEISTAPSITFAAPAVVPQFVWVSVARARNGSFDLPPVFVDQAPYAGTSCAVPAGFLEPRRTYFVSVGFGVGTKMSVTTVQVTTATEGSLLATLVDSGSAESGPEEPAVKFKRKGKLPGSAYSKAKSVTNNTLKIKIGSMKAVSIPLSKVSGMKTTIATPAHAAIESVTLDFKRRRFRVRGSAPSFEVLGSPKDVRIRIE